MLASIGEVKPSAVNTGSTRGQPGVHQGSTWDQPGVNLGSAWGQPWVNMGSAGVQPEVNLGSPWDQPGVSLHPPYHARASTGPLLPAAAARLRWRGMEGTRRRSVEIMLAMVLAPAVADLKGDAELDPVSSASLRCFNRHSGAPPMRLPPKPLAPPPPPPSPPPPVPPLLGPWLQTHTPCAPPTARVAPAMGRHASTRAPPWSGAWHI